MWAGDLACTRLVRAPLFARFVKGGIGLPKTIRFLSEKQRQL